MMAMKTSGRSFLPKICKNENFPNRDKSTHDRIVVWLSSADDYRGETSFPGVSGAQRTVLENPLRL